MRHDQHRYPDDLAEMARWVESHAAAGDRVLEIGCGDGALTELLARRGLQVLGVDPAAPSAAHLWAGSIDDLDAAPFDLVVASVSLHHLPDPDVTVATLRRLTSKGTTILVREFDRVLLDHEPTLRWWFHQRWAMLAVDPPADDEHPMAAAFDDFVAEWREHMTRHVLPWSEVAGVLGRAGCETVSQRATSYLYRWGLAEAVRPLEERLIATGALRAVGIRWEGRRR
jgi:ubiquinone/menaquinone biosynthesis C-methylase UbiE